MAELKEVEKTDGLIRILSKMHRIFPHKATISFSIKWNINQTLFLLLLNRWKYCKNSILYIYKYKTWRNFFLLFCCLFTWASCTYPFEKKTQPNTMFGMCGVYSDRFLFALFSSLSFDDENLIKRYWRKEQTKRQTMKRSMTTTTTTKKLAATKTS